MAREPSGTRADRTHAAPTGASDISVYGATPIALGVPAIAMTLGGAPAAADSGAVLPVAAESVSPITQAGTLTASADGGGGFPLDAALTMPAILADAAIASMATLVAPQSTNAADAEPVSATPDASAGSGGGSGTPPGLLVPPVAAPTEMTDAAPGRVGDVIASLPATSGIHDIAQAAQDHAEAAMNSIGDRIEAIDDRVADIGDRLDAIDSDLDDALSDTIGGVVSTLDDRVAAIDDAVNGTLASASAQIAGLGEGLAGTLADIDLGPVGGVDPAGGITTLVGMVSAADMFGLPDIGGGDAFSLPVLGSAGGDLLGDFAPADVLLTVSDAHDGAFGLLAGLVDGHSG